MTDIQARVGGAPSRTVHFRLPAVVVVVVLLGVAAVPAATAQLTPTVQAAPQATIVRVTASADPVRRGNMATVRYELTQPCALTVAIVDARGAVVRSFRFPAATGPSVFEWDLRFDGPRPVAEPEPGPLAPPGLYFARVMTGDHTRAQPFSVAPRAGARKASDADYAAALDLALKTRQLQSAVNESLLGLRAVRTQVGERVHQTSGALMESAQMLVNSLTDAERDVLGAQDVSGSTLAREGIRQRLASLAQDLGREDGQPSRASRARFEFLKGEVEHLQTQTRQRIEQRLEDFNTAAKAQGVELVGWPADTSPSRQTMTGWVRSAGALDTVERVAPANPAETATPATRPGEIWFDSKGVEFRPWLQTFIAQLKRNWLIPMAVMTLKGHVVVTFVVQRDGEISDISVPEPSKVPTFDQSAIGALVALNRTPPLPADYPGDRCQFTVRFNYNETPPKH